jgi:hypothetical protein
MLPPGMSLPKDSRGLLRGVNRHERAAEMPHVIVKLNESFEGRVCVEVRGQPRPHLDQVEGNRGGGQRLSRLQVSYRSPFRFGVYVRPPDHPRTGADVPHERHADVLCLLPLQRAGIGPTLGRPAQIRRRRGGGSSRVARAARGRARLAAIATRRMLPTLGPYSADPPPAMAGRGGSPLGASHERQVGVLGSPRLLRAGCGPPLGCPAQICRQPWWAAAAASHERHVGVPSSLRSRRAGRGPTLGRPTQIRHQP